MVVGRMLRCAACFALVCRMLPACLRMSYAACFALRGRVLPAGGEALRRSGVQDGRLLRKQQAGRRGEERRGEEGRRRRMCMSYAGGAQ
jgi:hypothetical protein